MSGSEKAFFEVDDVDTLKRKKKKKKKNFSSFSFEINEHVHISIDLLAFFLSLTLFHAFCPIFYMSTDISRRSHLTSSGRG